jgi:DNA-binding transcriptional ArsR family regulator
MSTQPNERLNQGGISILRLLFRHGELSVSSISGLLGLYETMVEHHSQELFRRKLISLKRQDNQTLLRLEPKGLAYLREGDHV